MPKECTCSHLTLSRYTHHTSPVWHLNTYGKEQKGSRGLDGSETQPARGELLALPVVHSDLVYILRTERENKFFSENVYCTKESERGQCCGKAGKATTCDAGIPRGSSSEANGLRKAAENGSSVWTPAPQLRDPDEAAGSWL